MLRKISLILAVITLLTSLFSCGKEETVIEYEDEKFFSVEDEEHGMIVNEKTFDYEGNGIVVLNVKSKTENNYNVTIKGTFYDADGNEIKSISKSFSGFPADWENNFIFQSSVSFDQFSYELTTSPYNGDTYAQFLEIGTTTEAEVYEIRNDQKNGTEYEEPRAGLRMQYPIVCTSSKILICKGDCILLNNQGEIYIADKFEIGIHYDDYKSLLYPMLDVLYKDYKFPDELKGDLTMICGFTEVDSAK